MNMYELAEKAKMGLEQLTGLKASSVIGFTQDEGNWMVTLEMVEKKSIPDSMDILGAYEVKMDPEGNVLDFMRTKLRKRGDLVEV